MRGRRRERGQSMVETVIVLPVVLLLFLGLYFLKELVDTRMRAVEAARYLTWESVWNARETRSKRAIKTNVQLRQDLEKMGLGRGLVSIDGSKAVSLRTYANSKTGAGTFTEVPDFIKNIFTNPERTATGSSVTPGTSNVPGFGEGGVGGALEGILGKLDDPAFIITDFFANSTLWSDETNKAVYSSTVQYRVRGRSVFAFLGDTNIKQTGSILAHPFNVLRDNDKNEYERVFGKSGITDCTGAAGGHIFPLWFAPSPEGVPVVKEVGTVGKCFLSGFGKAIGIADILGGDLKFKLPDGTLKEYPEKNK